MIISSTRRWSNNIVGLLTKGSNEALQDLDQLRVDRENTRTIRTKRSDAGRQVEDAESNNEVRLSNSSKAGVVKCEVGARVTRMHIIVLEEINQVYIASL